MLLKQDLKWSPDGIHIEVIVAGEYSTQALPARAWEIAAQAGLVEQEPNSKGAKPVKEKKSTASKDA